MYSSFKDNNISVVRFTDICTITEQYRNNTMLLKPTFMNVKERKKSQNDRGSKNSGTIRVFFLKCSLTAISAILWILKANYSEKMQR